MEREIEPSGASEPAPGHGSDRMRVALWVCVLVLIGAFLWILSPFWGWLTLAAWFAAAARPVLGWLGKALHGRNRAAAALTVLLFVVVTLPVVGIVASIAADAVTLFRSLLEGGSVDDQLRSLVVVPDPSVEPSAPETSLVELVEQNGARAFELLSGVAGSVGAVFVGLFVFFAAAYSFLADGPRAYAWVEQFAPATRANLRRMSDAFLETGRGLFIGAGMTGLVQAVIATTTYFALGLPRALVLGLLTFVSSSIPGFGTALVWLPLAVGLALTDRLTAGIVLAVIGTIFVSGIDSVVRPFFVRWGKLDLHPFVTLISMFGALILVGPWGIVLGPLVARLTLEIIRIAQKERVL